MKNIFITLSLIVPLHLLALEPRDIYTQANEAYKAKDYKTSYELFLKLYLTNLSDANLNFNFGKSAFEIGNYEIALAAFERVEMLDPTNLRNKLEKARVYFILKMYEDAELAFEEVLSNPMIPQNVRTNIEFYLSQVKKAQKKSFTYVNINLDFLYDSNINAAPINNTYNIRNIEYSSPSEKSDMATQLFADVTNIYEIDRANGLSIKNRLLFHSTSYLSESDYNINYFSYMPSMMYKHAKYTFEMIFGADVMAFGGKNYLQTFSLMPRFEYAHNNNLRSILHFRHQTKSFKQSAQKGLDADLYELSYGIQRILTPRSYFQANLAGVQEKKHSGDRVDVNYNEYRADAIYANQFTPIYAYELNAYVRKRAYDDFSTLFNSTRDDFGRGAGLSLTAKIGETLRFRVKTRYDRVDSNQEVFSYHRYMISAGIVKTF